MNVDAVEVYRANDGWRWRQGDMESGVSYPDRQDCFDVAETPHPGAYVYLEGS